MLVKTVANIGATFSWRLNQEPSGKNAACGIVSSEHNVAEAFNGPQLIEGGLVKIVLNNFVDQSSPAIVAFRTVLKEGQQAGVVVRGVFNFHVDALLDKGWNICASDLCDVGFGNRLVG